MALISNRYFFAILAFCFTWFCDEQTHASDGDLDVSFGAGGLAERFTGSGRCMVVQPDGKILVGGDADRNGNRDFIVIRYLPDGSMDRTFGDKGKALGVMTGSHEQCMDMALQQDGKILLVGLSQKAGMTDLAMMRFRPDGTLDDAFGRGGRVIHPFSATGGLRHSRATSIVVRDDGRLLLAGCAKVQGDTRAFLILRSYLKDGNVDPGFGSNGLLVTEEYNTETCDGRAILQPDGSIVLAGVCSRLGSNRLTLVRIPANGGTASASLPSTSMEIPGLKNQALSLTRLTHGILVTAGVSIGQNSGFALARCHPDGSPDMRFGNQGQVIHGVPGLRDAPWVHHVQADERIVVAGQVEGSGGGDAIIMRFTSDGSADMDFGAGGQVITDFLGGEDRVTGLTTQKDGKILAAGFSTGSPGSEVVLTRYGNVPFPEARAISVEELTATTAILRGFVNANTARSPCAVSFEISTDGTTYREVPATPGQVTGSTPQPISAEVSGLTPGALHYVRVRTVGSAGSTVSSDLIFNALSDDASLSEFTIDHGKLSPAFHPSTLNYVVTLPYDAANRQVSAQTTHPAARLKVNGQQMERDNSLYLYLKHGEVESITVDVTAEDGSRRAYEISAIWAAGPAGSVDLSFRRGHWTGQGATGGLIATCLAAQPDGKILMGCDPARIMRYNADGSQDLTFGNMYGYDSSGDTVTALALQKDGKILAVGKNDSSMSLRRLDRHGQRDRSFGSYGEVITKFVGPSQGTCLALQEDEKIVVGGFTDAGKVALVRHLANGKLDPTFGLGGYAQDTWQINAIQSLAIQPDGKIVLAGTTPSSYQMVLLRYTASGAPDTSFGTNGKAAVYLSTRNEACYGMALQPDGKIVMAGVSIYDDDDSQFVLTRHTSEGKLDPTFGGDGQVISQVGDYAEGYGMTLQKDGKIVVVGTAGVLPGEYVNVAVARYLPDGRMDSSFGDGGTLIQPVGSLHSIGLATTILPNGRIAVAGFYYYAPANEKTNLLLSVLHDGEPAAPEIFLTSPESDYMQTGDGVNFSTIGVAGQSTKTVTITNIGSGYLRDLEARIEGANADMFEVKMVHEGQVLAPGKTVAIKVSYFPRLTGAHTASLRITSNDADEPEIILSLSGQSNNQSGTLYTRAHRVSEWSVSWDLAAADWQQWRFWIEFGPTAAYGTLSELIAEDGDYRSDTNTDFSLSAARSEFKHQVTCYRLRARGPKGEVIGPPLSCVHQEFPPSAVQDQFRVHPGQTLTLDVLANDWRKTDSLSIVSITKRGDLTTTAQGRLTLVNGTVVFEASPIFGMQKPNGNYPENHFSYVVKNGAGQKSTGQVYLHFETVKAITPESRDVSFVGGSHDVEVTADAADSWLATPLSPWLSLASPVRYTGSSKVTIVVQPNSGVKERSGQVRIGGRMHVIKQQGISAPDIFMPGWVSAAIVGGAYHLEIPTFGSPVTYTVSGLPPGLTLNQLTGIISGRPAKEGEYPVVIKARNAAGAAPGSLSFSIRVVPLPESVVGLYHGWIPGHPSLNAQMGSRFEMTTTSLGTISGKITTGSVATPFTTRLEPDVDAPQSPFATVSIPRRGTTPLMLDVQVDGETNTLSGTLESPSSGLSIPVAAWRQVWGLPARTAAGSGYSGLHTFHLSALQQTDDVPQGYGFGSFTVHERNGTFTITGKLPDNNALLSRSFLGPQGQILVYQSLYAGKGSFGGLLTLTAQPAAVAGNTVTGAPMWFKPQPADSSSRDTLYREGFGPKPFEVEGGTYPPPAAGGLVLGLQGSNASASADFTRGGLEVEMNEFGITFSMLNPGKALIQKAVFPDDNPGKVTLTTVNAATGTFSGEFTLPGLTPSQNRKTSYQGLLVRDSHGIHGYGFFLLPEPIVPPLTLSTSTKHSGRVILRAVP